MKNIFNWIVDSNHYKHILLSCMLAILSSSIFGLFSSMTITLISATITTLITGICIEIYQYMLTKKLDKQNTLYDLLSDIIGCALGILIFYIVVTYIPTSSIILYIMAVISFIIYFIVKPRKKIFILLTLLFGFLGFASFVFNAIIY